MAEGLSRSPPGARAPAPARPPISVVLPFHGSAAAAEAALEAMRALALEPGDEIVVVDNSPRPTVPDRSEIIVVRADREHSAYHARNVGAERATNDWLLFVDADCRPRPDLLDRYFDIPPAKRCGAVLGEIVGAPGQPGLVSRYARSRGHLGQAHHWRHPFRPFGVTANLLVRRAAWASVGGFQEGVRSGGDTEFSFRLQDDGWMLEFRPEAIVEHMHRERVRELVRQAARYAAGRAWVIRRYPGSFERPALLRRLARCAVGVVVWTATGRFERAAFKALDAVYVVSECGAFLLSNTPPGEREAGVAEVGVLAGSFPDAHDPARVSEVHRIAAARLGATIVEAESRPLHVDRSAAAQLTVRYAEDDGTLRRISAMAWLLARAPRGALRHRRLASRCRRLARSGVGVVVGVGGAADHRDAEVTRRLLGLQSG